MNKSQIKRCSNEVKKNVILIVVSFILVMITIQMKLKRYNRTISRFLLVKTKTR